MKGKLIAAAAVAGLVLLSLIAFGAGARKTPATIQNQSAASQQGGWRPSPLKALTLVSAEPLNGNPKVTIYRLRNDSGRGIAGFILSHDESENSTDGHSFFTRLHVRQLEPDILPPAGEEEVVQETSTIERLSAVMYDDASVEGEPESVELIENEVRQFEEGLAQELADLEAASHAKGVAKGTAEIAARGGEGKAVRDAAGNQHGVIANKSTGAMVLEGALHNLLLDMSPAEAKAELERRVKTRLSKTWAKGGTNR